ncbi:hypothetical protein WJX72_004217 [[Myrmecia] bisecta]|uniref:Uncharacterized protein n=1 Tax=[Myrmecia] bisecta TaxID=41462 RepID=A0AAW1Q3D8_9CHLO
MPRPSTRLQAASATDDGRFIPEDHPAYRRVDMSELHAYAARQQFAQQCAQGEAGINLAEAALHISAEDDALVSHSTVPLPVASYLKRLSSMALELARLRLAHLPPDTAAPEDVLQVVEDYLFKEQCFRLPAFGRSNVPAGALVDHPGVWEDARHAYLHEALVSKKGIAAVLAVIYSDIMQRLLACGAINFAVRMECRDFNRLPQASVLHGMTRASLLRPDGSITNTCTSAALVEMLRFLKRAYWPFPWQTSPVDRQQAGIATGGGFAGAAQVALEGEADAQLQAIARTAKHRLERGIWTSPGAGDLRRAKAACERLAILCGDDCPTERRQHALNQY